MDQDNGLRQFSMQCYREVGQKLERKLWFLEGVQLCEVEALPKGENGYDHFSLGVEDVEAVMKYVEKEYPECEIVSAEPDGDRVEAV